MLLPKSIQRRLGRPSTRRSSQGDCLAPASKRQTSRVLEDIVLFSELEMRFEDVLYQSIAQGVGLAYKRVKPLQCCDVYCGMTFWCDIRETKSLRIFCIRENHKGIEQSGKCDLS